MPLVALGAAPGALQDPSVCVKVSPPDQAPWDQSPLAPSFPSQGARLCLASLGATCPVEWAWLERRMRSGVSSEERRRGCLTAEGPRAVYWTIGSYRLKVRGGWAERGVTVTTGNHLEPSKVLDLGHGASRAAEMGFMRPNGLVSHHSFTQQMSPSGRPPPQELPVVGAQSRTLRKDLAPSVPRRRRPRLPRPTGVPSA